jgi:hypothetical protein
MSNHTNEEIPPQNPAVTDATSAPARKGAAKKATA